jgi:hypothetical protein
MECEKERDGKKYGKKERRGEKEKSKKRGEWRENVRVKNEGESGRSEG